MLDKLVLWIFWYLVFLAEGGRWIYFKMVKHCLRQRLTFFAFEQLRGKNCTLMHGKNCARSYVPLHDTNNSSNLTWHLARYLNWPVYCPDNFKYNISLTSRAGESVFGQKWVRFASNGIKPWVFQLIFEYIFARQVMSLNHFWPLYL